MAYRVVSNPLKSQSLRCMSMCSHTQEHTEEERHLDEEEGNEEGTSKGGVRVVLTYKILNPHSAL